MRCGKIGFHFRLLASDASFDKGCLRRLSIKRLAKDTDSSQSTSKKKEPNVRAPLSILQ
jgi:hypothetical protein